MLSVTSSPGYLSNSHFSEVIKRLGEFVAIPSLSNPNSNLYQKNNLFKAAAFVGYGLKRIGSDIFNIYYKCIKDSPPYVLGGTKPDEIDPSKPTILFYGHYDVQPVNPAEWLSDPFTLVERNGRLYGRGSSDDKGGIMAFIAAIEACRKANIPLPNIKFLIEGEEEYSSSHMEALIKEKTAALGADVAIIMDGLNKDTQTAAVTSSTRGLVNIIIEIKALAKPVHSGIGCLVPDPAQVLAFLVTSLRNPLLIPGFMDDVKQLNEEEKRLLRQGSVDATTYAKDMGVKPGVQLRGDPSRSVYERIFNEPSISIVNMTSGQPNGGNSIQDTARCTVGIRVLPGQDPQKVAESVIQYLRSQNVGQGMEINIKQVETGAWAWMADLTSRFSQVYFDAQKKTHPSACHQPCGGAIPLLHQLKQLFPKMEIIVPGVEDPGTDAHSHNESQHIDLFRRSIETVVEFLKQAGKIKLNTRGS